MAFNDTETLKPGVDYGWIVSYSDSITQRCFMNVISIPDNSWLADYKSRLAKQFSSAQNEYGELGLAFFLLDNHQYCQAKSAYQKAAALNAQDAMIQKSRLFFKY